MKRVLKRIGLLFLIAAAAAAGYCYLADRTTPSGQAPLTTIDTAMFADVKTEFNRAQDKVRIIVLLAPT